MDKPRPVHRTLHKFANGDLVTRALQNESGTRAGHVVAIQITGDNNVSYHVNWSDEDTDVYEEFELRLVEDDEAIDYLSTPCSGIDPTEE